MYKIIMFLIATASIYKVSFHTHLNLILKLSIIYLIVLAMRLFVLH